MMFKPFILIVTGLIFWYSVDCRVWTTMHLVGDCFEYECRPKNAENNDENNAENNGTDNAANNATNNAINITTTNAANNATNNATNDATTNARKSTKNEEKVCGVNGVLYDNMEALKCANKCAGYFDHVITVKPLGFCSEKPTALDFY